MKSMDSIIKIGVSTCLLGEKVRFDGGHKHNRYITQHPGSILRPSFPSARNPSAVWAFPSEAMRLVGEVNAPRLVTNKTGIDHTEKMLSWA
jgi:uncharacterized protein YbbK (DUF523 family)